MNSYTITAQAAFNDPHLWIQLGNGEVELRIAKGEPHEGQTIINMMNGMYPNDYWVYFSDKTTAGLKKADLILVTPLKAQNVSAAASTPPAPADTWLQAGVAAGVRTPDGRITAEFVRGVLDDSAKDGADPAEVQDVLIEALTLFNERALLIQAAQAVLDDLQAVGVEPFSAQRLRDLLPKKGDQ